ncbi:MAG: F0F1 ATP synthase subunit B [Pseudomonadota bacterium]
MNINLTLIAQLISFAVFVWFTLRFIWPPLMDAMNERKAKIADGLAAAEQGQQAQAQAQQEVESVLQQARVQAAEIKSNAEKEATRIVDQARVKGRAEAERQLTAAQAEIAQETNKAREGLRAKVAELVVAGAEKILQKEIDVKAHQAILNRVAQQI